MTAPEGQRGGEKSFRDARQRAGRLVIAYVKQETVDPLRVPRALRGRSGSLGALLFAVGGGLLALAAIRAVQSETGRHLTGDLTWVPYVGGLIVAGVGAAGRSAVSGSGPREALTSEQADEAVAVSQSIPWHQAPHHAHRQRPRRQGPDR